MIPVRQRPNTPHFPEHASSHHPATRRIEIDVLPTSKSRSTPPPLRTSRVTAACIETSARSKTLIIAPQLHTANTRSSSHLVAYVRQATDQRQKHTKQRLKQYLGNIHTSDERYDSSTQCSDRQRSTLVACTLPTYYMATPDPYYLLHISYRLWQRIRAVGRSFLATDSFCLSLDYLRTRLQLVLDLQSLEMIAKVSEYNKHKKPQH